MKGWDVQLTGVGVFLAVLAVTAPAGSIVLFRISDAEFLRPIARLVRIGEAFLSQSYGGNCVPFGLQRRCGAVIPCGRVCSKDRVRVRRRRSHGGLIFSFVCAVLTRLFLGLTLTTV